MQCRHEYQMETPYRSYDLIDALVWFIKERTKVYGCEGQPFLFDQSDCQGKYVRVHAIFRVTRQNYYECQHGSIASSSTMLLAPVTKMKCFTHEAYVLLLED